MNLLQEQQRHWNKITIPVLKLFRVCSVTVTHGQIIVSNTSWN